MWIVCWFNGCNSILCSAHCPRVSQLNMHLIRITASITLVYQVDIPQKSHLSIADMVVVLQ